MWKRSGERWPAWVSRGNGPNTGSRVRIRSTREKKRLERRITWADRHPDWITSFANETGWRRWAPPALSTGCDGAPLRWVQRSLDKNDPEPKALCGYGLVRQDQSRVWLRFVDGRPVSPVTTDFLAWVCRRLADEGKKGLLLIWDNASWHKSREVRHWIRAHNRRVKKEGGVRWLGFRWPTQSPWLNPMEPRWVHGKRAIVEPTRTLTAQEVADRVCAYFGCDHLEHLKQHVS